MNEESTTFGDGVSITEAIIEATCNLRGIEPEEFDYVLYDWVDPDALSRLLKNPPGSRRSITVEFTLSDYHVTARHDPTGNDRTVTVRSAPRGASVPGLSQEGTREI